MLFKRPDVILIDMDNTMYDYDPCHNDALIKVESCLHKAIDMKPSVFRDLYKMARQEVHSRLSNTASSHNRLLYFKHLLEYCGHGMKISLAVRLNDIYWDTFVDRIKINEGVLEFLEYTKKLKIPIALITDLTADIQFRKIIRLNLEDMIDVVVTSEEAGNDKPSAVIFELALKKLNCKALTTWMVGDSLLKDIDGGKSIGAVTFLKACGREEVDNSSVNIKPDFVFESFYELIDILNGIEKNAA